MTPITIETASLLCDVSTRTIRRRMDDGSILKLFEDDRGRTMLSLDDVIPFARLRLTDDEKLMVEEADAGNAEAMGLVGSLFVGLRRYNIAKKWLEMASKQGNADAMQTLGRCYLEEPDQDENLALMWLAKAASLGHSIARQQVTGLASRVRT